MALPKQGSVVQLFIEFAQYLILQKGTLVACILHVRPPMHLFRLSSFRRQICKRQVRRLHGRVCVCMWRTIEVVSAKAAKSPEDTSERACWKFAISLSHRHTSSPWLERRKPFASFHGAPFRVGLTSSKGKQKHKKNSPHFLGDAWDLLVLFLIVFHRKVCYCYTRLMISVIQSVPFPDTTNLPR